MPNARTVLRVLPLLVGLGCAGGGTEPNHATAASATDPVVDMACVQRARDGKLLADLPAQIGRYMVTPALGGVHLHRDGRARDDADGKRLWDVFSHAVFGHGMAQADHGMYSTYACSDVDKRSCIKLALWTCQVSLAAFAEKLTNALDHAGFDDAELSVDVTFLEARGPKCRAGAGCAPMQHYSTHGTYLTGAAVPRNSHEAGVGTCTNDGDCEPGGQACMPWYLVGGISTAEYRQYSTPTFCGCVSQRCRWFQQE